MNKIDTIIDALEGMCGDRCNTEYNLCQASVALAAARSLRELKPVAWAAPSIWGELEGLSFDKQPRFDIPLYALDEEKNGG
jgi:hypothetical protein